MNASQRLVATLNFEKMKDGGSVLETFYPWTLSAERWSEEGLSKNYSREYLYPPAKDRSKRYFDDLMTEHVYEFEQELGFEPMKRMAFRVPFKCFDTKILEETDKYVLRFDEDGWTRKYYKNSELVENIKAPLECEEDWPEYKEKILYELEHFCTDDKLKEIYGKYEDGHKKGEYSISFKCIGFFWASRELLGIEEQLIAFYDEPELIHAINSFLLEKYMEYYDKIFSIIQPEVLIISEDLSGANGPMISPAMFDEFVGAYYAKLIPFLKKKGVKNIFVDTDGDFKLLIPNFIEVGVDGFVPMDVNAGMDIVEVRKQYPKLKFIGAFNKLKIAEGKDAIDKEFQRLLPVIRQGGYIPGSDHQVAPSTSLENYKYYIGRLKEAMLQAGADAE